MNESLPTFEVTPESIAKNLSFVMLKPENMEKGSIFPAILKNYGLACERHHVILTHENLMKMYDGMVDWDENLKQVTLEHMAGETAEVLLVTSDGTQNIDNVTSKVLEIRGNKTNPNQNNPNSLRYVFRGDEIRYQNENGQESSYWENGIHCPRNSSELVKNLEIFNLLNRAKELVIEKN